MEKLIETPTWSADGLTLSNILEKGTNLYVTYNVVTKWYDGSFMDDEKLDSDLVYVKYEGKYLVQNFEYGQTLQKDSIEELRNLSSKEVLLLKMKVYDNIQLNNVINKRDLIDPLFYTLYTGTKSPDNYTIISTGDIKIATPYFYINNIKHLNMDYKPELSVLQNDITLQNANNILSTSDGLITTLDFGHRAGTFTYTKNKGEYKLISNFDRFKPETNANFVPVAVYVDQDNGNAANNGLSWATAKSRFDHAIALNPDIIFVKHGTLQGPSAFFQNLTITKDLAIIAVGGDVITGTVQKGNYTKETGFTNVYRRATSSQGTTQEVVDLVYRDKFGTPRIYTQVSSIALVNSTEGSFFREANGEVLIHPFGSRYMPTKDDTIVMRTIGADMTFTFNGNHKLYIEGFTFTGAPSFVVKGNGTELPGSVFYNKNCKWLNIKRNGMSITDIGLCISEGTEIHYSLRDGFNYHWGKDLFGGQTELSPHFIELNCISTANGYLQSNLNNQGSTSHEDCIGFRFNCIYNSHKDGGCLVDVGGTRCYIVNPIVTGSSIVGMYLSSSAGGTDGRKAKWWIDGGIIKNNLTEPNAGAGDISVAGSFAELHIVDEVTDKPTYLYSNVTVANRNLNQF